MTMRLRFDITQYDKVYHTLVNKLGICEDCFLTDDCIEIESEDFDRVQKALPEIKFTEI